KAGSPTRPVAARRLRSCPRRPGSFSYDLDEDLSRARAVELAEEDALPATEHEVAVHDRDRLRRRREDAGAHVRPAVRVEVVVVQALGADVQVVVPVVAAGLGGQLAQ